jgi:predicted transcriptional regulator
MALKMINVKLDPKMHEALRRLAEKEFSTISTLVKQAIDKFLAEEKGIDWRQEKGE